MFSPAVGGTSGKSEIFFAPTRAKKRKFAGLIINAKYQEDRDTFRIELERTSALMVGATTRLRGGALSSFILPCKDQVCSNVYCASLTIRVKA